MYPITLEAYQNDPALRRRLFETAHRERTRAIRDGFASLLGGFVWLRDRLTPRIRFRPSRWIGRLG